jgi:hypothetical protein
MAKVFMVPAKLCSLNLQRGCRLAWSRLVDLGSIDPGSNPGSPIQSVTENRSMAEKKKKGETSAQGTSEGQVRLRSWQEFKRLVTEKNPGSIVFILEQNGFTADKELTILRLIMLHGKRYYIFIDAPKGDTLRETGIPLRKDKRGTRFLDEDEVKNYLKNQFEAENLEIYSFWTA